jgi:hypothetical protein
LGNIQPGSLWGRGTLGSVEGHQSPVGADGRISVGYSRWLLYSRATIGPIDADLVNLCCAGAKTLLIDDIGTGGIDGRPEDAASRERRH